VLRDGFPSRMSPNLVSRLRGVIGLARVGVRLHALLQNSPRGDLRGVSRLGIFDYRGSLRRRRRPRAMNATSPGLPSAPRAGQATASPFGIGVAGWPMGPEGAHDLPRVGPG
jgi:hypothetical protein